MIYAISNPMLQTIDYVCPDQQTINDGNTLGFFGTYVVGDEQKANKILNENRTAWLTANLNLFTVTKDIDPDPLQTTWIVCNLSTEPDNIDVDYNIFNVLNGTTETITGLNNAKALLEETINNTVQDFIQLTFFETFPRINENIISIGLQEL